MFGSGTKSTATVQYCPFLDTNRYGHLTNLRFRFRERKEAVFFAPSQLR